MSVSMAARTALSGDLAAMKSQPASRSSSSSSLLSFMPFSAPQSRRHRAPPARSCRASGRAGPGQLTEGGLGVDPWFLREAENPFSQDVLHDLLGAAEDSPGRRGQQQLG